MELKDLKPNYLVSFKFGKDLHKGIFSHVEEKTSKDNIRKKYYTRVPRRKKKWQKKQVAMIDGKPVKHLRYDYLGCYYWIK